MIYGRLIAKDKFFRKNKPPKKESYALSGPSSSMSTPPAFPVIKDHISHHIRATENAIEDNYSSNKPTALKIQSLGRNLSKLGKLDTIRKNTGIFRITKNPPPAPPPSAKTPSRKKEPVYNISKLFPDEDDGNKPKPRPRGLRQNPPRKFKNKNGWGLIRWQPYKKTSMMWE